MRRRRIGFGQFEGRSYKGLLRHMILCQPVLLFVAEETDQLRGDPGGGNGGWGGGRETRGRRLGEKTGADHGADGACFEWGLPMLAGTASKLAGV